MTLKKQLFLRWTNKITQQGRNKASRSRPDAVVSILTQTDFVDGIGYGEAKLAEPTRNCDSLGRDLLRLGIFCKTSIDDDITYSPIGFQIHGKFIYTYIFS